MSYTEQKSMRAVHYEGPFKVSVKDIALPKLEHPDDVIAPINPRKAHADYLQGYNQSHHGRNLWIRSPHVSGKDRRERRTRVRT